MGRTRCYLTISPQTHVDQTLVLFYTSPSGPFWHRLWCCRPAELFQIPPHSSLSTVTFTEMVATALDACQLNTSRRILAEIQLRINGFNVYG